MLIEKSVMTGFESVRADDAAEAHRSFLEAHWHAESLALQTWNAEVVAISAGLLDLCGQLEALVDRIAPLLQTECPQLRVLDSSATDLMKATRSIVNRSS